jgi:hypothetical protein
MASHRANASGLCMGREAFTSDPAARALVLKHGGATCRSELPRERFRSLTRCGSRRSLLPTTPHSALIPNSLMIGHHFSMSAL